MLNLCTVRHLKNWCDQIWPNLTKFGNVISDCNRCNITNLYTFVYTLFGIDG